MKHVVLIKNRCKSMCMPVIHSRNNKYCTRFVEYPRLWSFRYEDMASLVPPNTSLQIYQSAFLELYSASQAIIQKNKRPKFVVPVKAAASAFGHSTVVL